MIIQFSEYFVILNDNVYHECIFSVTHSVKISLNRQPIQSYPLGRVIISKDELIFMAGLFYNRTAYAERLLHMDIVSVCLCFCVCVSDNFEPCHWSTPVIGQLTAKTGSDAAKSTSVQCTVHSGRGKCTHILAVTFLLGL